MDTELSRKKKELEEAIKSDSIEKAEALLLEGIDPSLKNEQNTPLIFTTENTELIKLLLEYGADPKAEDIHGFKVEDYTDDPILKELLNQPRKPLLTKFVKYRATIKTLRKTNKTRRSHSRVEKS